MAKQRNEPNDPAAELADYDFERSEGSSPEQNGTVATDTWPDHLDKSEVTDSGKRIISKWIASTYSELTESNIRKFRNDYDLPKLTTRLWLYRAFPEQRDFTDLKTNEKKAVVAVAAHGNDYSYKDYKDEFGFSNTQINMAKNGVPDIVKDLRKKHSQSKLESEAKQLKRSDSGNSATKSLPKGDIEEDKKQEFRAYFNEHPDATVHEAIDAVGVNANPSVVGGIKGGLKSLSGKSKSKSIENNDKTKTKADGKIAVTVELPREDARSVVVNQELNDKITRSVIESILDEVGL